MNWREHMLNHSNSRRSTRGEANNKPRMTDTQLREIRMGEAIKKKKKKGNQRGRTNYTPKEKKIKLKKKNGGPGNWLLLYELSTFFRSCRRQKAHDATRKRGKIKTPPDGKNIFISLFERKELYQN